MIEITTETTGHSVLLCGIVRNTNGRTARLKTRTNNPSRFGALREAVRYWNDHRPDIQTWVWAQLEDHVLIEEREVDGALIT